MVKGIGFMYLGEFFSLRGRFVREFVQGFQFDLSLVYFFCWLVIGYGDWVEEFIRFEYLMIILENGVFIICFFELERRIKKLFFIVKKNCVFINLRSFICYCFFYSYG